MDWHGEVIAGVLHEGNADVVPGVTLRPLDGQEDTLGVEREAAVDRVVERLAAQVRPGFLEGLDDEVGGPVPGRDGQSEHRVGL